MTLSGWQLPCGSPYEANMLSEQEVQQKGQTSSICTFEGTTFVVNFQKESTSFQINGVVNIKIEILTMI